MEASNEFRRRAPTLLAILLPKGRLLSNFVAAATR
jgi:hypothetical protein